MTLDQLAKDGYTCPTPQYLLRPQLKPEVVVKAYAYAPFDSNEPKVKTPKPPYRLRQIPASIVLTDEFIATDCMIIRSTLGCYAFALRGSKQQITRWGREYATASKRIQKLIKSAAPPAAIETD